MDTLSYGRIPVAHVMFQCIGHSCGHRYFSKKHASIIDRWHKTSPLHMLSMNPHAPASAFELLFGMWKWSIFKKDNKRNTPLEYAEVNNVAGLLAMIKCLCEYRNATVIPSAIPKKTWLGRLRKRHKKSNY